MILVFSVWVPQICMYCGKDLGGGYEDPNAKPGEASHGTCQPCGDKAREEFKAARGGKNGK